MLVCGVDVGSFNTLSYVAWLRDRRFLLDLYIPSIENPLPELPEGSAAPRFIAFDAPQGLSRPGRTRRQADVEAMTPTKRLPADRDELKTWKAYRELIVAGVEIFWSTYEKGLASIWGLEPLSEDLPTILETYPRYVIRRLWPRLSIPSKKKAPLEYVDTIWTRIRVQGYSCLGVRRPGVDHIDAMLCAMAADACLGCKQRPVGTVGEDPLIDREARLLREGWIVSP
jgi:predicted nuclease with RNAse H fold